MSVKQLLCCLGWLWFVAYPYRMTYHQLTVGFMEPNAIDNDQLSFKLNVHAAGCHVSYMKSIIYFGGNVAIARKE